MAVNRRFLALAFLGAAWGLLASLTACEPKKEPEHAPNPISSAASVQDESPAASSTPPSSPESVPAATGAAPTPSVFAPAAGSAALQGPPPEYLAAKKEVESTVQQNPSDYTLRMRAAEFYMRAGDHPSALPHLRKATGLSPKEPVPWIALGDAASISGRFVEAEKSYRAADRLRPGDPFIVRGRGQMLVMQRKFKEARAVLEAGLKKNPDDVEIRTALGNLLLVLNKAREATAVFEPAVQRAPDRPDLRYMLGDAYERDLQLNKALRELREAVRLDPNYTEAWGRIGLYLVNLTQYKEAREPLQKAIALNPAEAHYHWALGDSYLLDTTETGNFDKAAESYRKALAIDPNNEKALYSFAMALTRRGRPEDLKEAIRYFERMVAKKPQDMNVHYKLFQSYQRLGNEKKTAEHREKFRVLYEKGRVQNRTLQRNLSFVDTADAHARLGEEALATGDLKIAAKEFEIALDRDALHARARRGIAEVQARMAKERGGGQ